MLPGLRGLKQDVYEGGIRVRSSRDFLPHREQTRPSDFTATLWDVMPTLAEIAGAKTPERPGCVSVAPTLLGRGEQKAHEYLYWEFPASGRNAGRAAEETRKGVRTGVREGAQTSTR